MSGIKIETLNAVLDRFREFYPEAKVGMLQMFLYVGNRGQCDYREVVNYFNLPQSSATRWMMIMGEWEEYGVKPGMDLIERTPDPANRRRRIVHLTERGKRFFNELKRIIGDVD